MQPSHPSTPDSGEDATSARPRRLLRFALVGGALLLGSWAAWGRPAPGFICQRAQRELARRGAALGDPRCTLAWDGDVVLRKLSLAGATPDEPLIEADEVEIGLAPSALVGGRAAVDVVEVRRGRVHLRQVSSAWRLLAGERRTPLSLGEGTREARPPVRRLVLTDVVLLGPTGEREGALSGSLAFDAQRVTADLAWSRAGGGVRTANLAATARWAGVEAGQVELEVKGALTELTLAEQPLAEEVVGPFALEGELLARYDPQRRTAHLTRAVLGFADHPSVALAAEGALRASHAPIFTLSLVAAEVPYGDLVEALPAALRPPEAAPRPQGALTATLDVQGPLLEPAAWEVTAKLDLAGLRERSRGLRSALSGEVVHRGREADGRTFELRLSEENPDFWPLAELPDHLVKAVTLSEDAGFFGHAGFDFQEMLESWLDTRRRRGASTITQQLAKNLFLSPERTYVRKAREALIAVGLEATVPKARLLELYFNLIEWGPSLRGIGPAARYYFGKTPAELTPRESAFLTSIIPNPTRYHAYFLRGGLTPKWVTRVDELLLRMHRKEALDDQQLDAALREVTTFRDASSPM